MRRECPQWMYDAFNEGDSVYAEVAWNAVLLVGRNVDLADCGRAWDMAHPVGVKMRSDHGDDCGGRPGLWIDFDETAIDRALDAEDAS